MSNRQFAVWAGLVPTLTVLLIVALATLLVEAL